MSYSNDLIRFISSVPVLGDGTIPMNTIDSEQPFVSTLYDPVYSLTVIARKVQELINSGKIEVVSDTVDPNTIVYKALNSDLASYAPDIYTLLRAIVLESFALLYMIDNASANLQYVSAKDIKRHRTNLNYIADYLSTEPKYYHMIENLRDMNIAFGYMENQIDVIMGERGGR